MTQNRFLLEGKMAFRGIGVVFWLPRMIAGGGIVFISLFALDAFQAGTPLPEQLMGLVIHLIPSAVLIAVLVFAWRFELAGGIAFVALALMPFILLSNPFWMNFVLSAPFMAAGILFVVSYVLRRRDL